MNKEDITYIICVCIVVCSGVAGLTVYNINERNNFAKNMESAIAKGVDPLSVKCAYEQSPTATCITYALGKK
jgi:hypothetical protein